MPNKGEVTSDEARCVSIANALVDTAATVLSPPTQLIESLGLSKLTTRKARTAAGVADVNVYGPVRLTIQGRECRVDVTEVPNEIPVHVGQIPLEYLDFVVDLRQQKRIGNPAHGGERMLERY